MGESDMVTSAQAADVLHMRADSVVRKIRLGQIPAVKVGKQWLIRRETLEAMLQPPAPQGA